MFDDRSAVGPIVTIDFHRSTTSAQCSIVRFRITVADDLIIEQVASTDERNTSFFSSLTKRNPFVRVVRCVDEIIAQRSSNKTIDQRQDELNVAVTVSCLDRHVWSTTVSSEKNHRIKANVENLRIERKLRF